MMASNLIAIATFVGVLALLSPDSASGSLQRITFHEQINCIAGRTSSITDTNNNIRNTWMTNANSTHIVGLWKMHIQNAANGVIYELSFNRTNPPNGGCINKSAWPVAGRQNFSIISATRFGPADMTTSQLNLYTGVDFSGTQITLNGDRNNLGSLQIRSFTHFSNDTWTLFSGTRYNGSTTVLRPASATVRDNFVFKIDVDFRVGSVRKGNAADKIMVASLILVISPILASIM